MKRSPETQCSPQQCWTASSIMPPGCRSPAKATGSKTNVAPASLPGHKQRLQPRQPTEQAQMKAKVGQCQVADPTPRWVNSKVLLTQAQTKPLWPPPMMTASRPSSTISHKGFLSTASPWPTPMPHNALPQKLPVTVATQLEVCAACCTPALMTRKVFARRSQMDRNSVG